MVKNVYACLAHEAPDCVLDTVRNLNYNDPGSPIILYNGSRSCGTIWHGLHPQEFNVSIHPTPKPLQWGRLHDFAIDCMRFARQNFSFDTLTIVDSDQLSLRMGYSEHLGKFLHTHRNIGMLGTVGEPQSTDTENAPARAAWAEMELWRPFLSQFHKGEAKFPFWTFWPATVFTYDAATAIVERIDADPLLKAILEKTSILASEEIVLPTLTSLLGFDVRVNPCDNSYVRCKTQCSEDELRKAISSDSCYWVHPVPRIYTDRLRTMIREHHSQYGALGLQPLIVDEHTLPIVPTLRILRVMRSIEGWLSDDEADALMQTTRAALEADTSEQPKIVEVGSYCGKATVVLALVARHVRPGATVYAIDPHNARRNQENGRPARLPSSRSTFENNIRRAGLQDTVQPIIAESSEIRWTEEIALLLIDGVHDYRQTVIAFSSFAGLVRVGGYVVLHHYAEYYPGVLAFVNELLERPSFRLVAIRDALCILQKLAP
jgi:predicted O-methyltransferase YrrM